MSKKLPIGIDGFEKIRTNDFYYVDKTRLIKDLLEHTAYVNLFTRPRRFGKTLNMSMLQYFFETGSDGTLFEGLEIAGDVGFRDYLNQYDVIYLDMTGVIGETSIGDMIPYIQRNVTQELVEQYPGLRTAEGFAAVYMTGILPIKKDGSQSAISDFQEYSMLKPRQFAKYVGFTEDEVKRLCHD